MPFDENPEWYPGAGTCPKCGAKVSREQQRCDKCGAYVNGWKACGKNRCGNCHEKLQRGDKYCRLCGTKVGEGAYKPFNDIWGMQCIYGPPPIKRTHVCSKCGYSWTTDEMLDREEYCPKCGAPAPVTEERE